MIDLDHFKSINDTYGHQVGDAVLSGVAEIIKNNIRNTDIAARYGGEEFCLILTDTNLQSAVIAGEKLRRKIEIEPFKTPDDQKINITVSIGAAQIRQNDGHIDELLSWADVTMHQAKAAGRNKVVGF